MLPPVFLESAADDILALYGALDTRIVKSISQRLLHYGGVTAATAWQADMVQQSGLLFEDVIAAVAAITKQSDAAVRTLFENAGLAAVQYDGEIYTAAGLSAPPLRLSPRAMQTLAAGFRKTNGALRNLTMTTALEAQQSFIRAATAAEMMVESGAFDAATAVRTVIKEAAIGGAFVQYPSGHRDHLDVAVRRAVITGTNQTCAEISMGYADDMGCDLVETTAHHGARPEHAVWQGRVFSRSGKHKNYPDFVSSTHYGYGDGLCGWNCRHSFFPFFEGLSASAYPRDYGDEKLYHDTQQQRGMERSIRATKRELVALDAAKKEKLAGAKDDFSAAAVKLKKQEAKLQDFITAHGLQKNTSRTGVNGFGHSTAGKAVWADKKSSILLSENKPFLYDKQIKSLEKEEAIVYDVNGKFIAKFIGSKSSVVISGIDKSILQNAILSHNHPSGGPLSDTDIYSLWKAELSEIRAATPHGIFVAKRPVTWKKIPNIETIRKEFFSYANKYQAQIHRRIDSGVLTVNDGEYLLQRLVMRRLTRDYGLKMELIPW